MAFEPGTVKDDNSLYAPYIHRTQTGLNEMNITRDVYDWYSDPEWEWFRRPKKLGRGTWTHPYFDEGAGNVRMITYSVPFFRKGRFAGVTTVDIHLRRLKEVVDDEILAKLKFEVFTSDGAYVYSDRAERIMHKTIHQLATEHNRLEWLSLAYYIGTGKSGMTKLRGFLSPKVYWTFYTPIESAGWSFTFRIPEDQVLSSIRSRRAIALSALALTLALIAGCIIYMSGLITRPIAQLNQKVLEVAKGNLDVQTDDIKSKDEIGKLATSFDKMTGDLRLYVQKLKTLAKLERDLQLARQIQQRTLPSSLPEMEGFDIAAWNQPAEETGGDIYDVIGYRTSKQETDVQTNENANRAILMLADATGHGIGPALSVTQVRTMLRMGAHISQDISVIAEHMNEQLCADLPDDRFITAWLGEISSSGHSIRFFSAGQGPLLRYNAAGDTFDILDSNTCPFGIAETIDTSASGPINLAKGDIFAVISDGIFEAANPKGQQFGEQRVMTVIRENRDAPAADILAALRQAVEDFIEGIPPEDDRTIIFIKRT
jgi:serine phosphatase RsbU (regulator of sigma subunit)